MIEMNEKSTFFHFDNHTHIYICIIEVEFPVEACQLQSVETTCTEYGSEKH